LLNTLHRYWLRFDVQDPPLGSRLGVGVSAGDLQDALELVYVSIYRGRGRPVPIDVLEDVDPAQLDANHVIPNSGDPNVRGVWFPLGYA
jgi:hypothetical protein